MSDKNRTILVGWKTNLRLILTIWHHSNANTSSPVLKPLYHWTYFDPLPSSVFNRNATFCRVQNAWIISFSTCRFRAPLTYFQTFPKPPVPEKRTSVSESATVTVFGAAVLSQDVLETTDLLTSSAHTCLCTDHIALQKTNTDSRLAATDTSHKPHYAPCLPQSEIYPLHKFWFVMISHCTLSPDRASCSHIDWIVVHRF